MFPLISIVYRMYTTPQNITLKATYSSMFSNLYSMIPNTELSPATTERGG